MTGPEYERLSLKILRFGLDVTRFSRRRQILELRVTDEDSLSEIAQYDPRSGFACFHCFQRN